MVIVFISTGATAAEVSLLCTLDDADSVRYCERSSLAASACQRSFGIDDENKSVRVLNGGRILPDFEVRTWEPTRLSALRTVPIVGTKIKQVFETYIDRITGRLIESSLLIDGATNHVLTAAEAESFAAERVKRDGLWGALELSTTTGMCKVVQPAIPMTNGGASRTLTDDLLEISRAINKNLPVKIDNEKVLDSSVVINDTLIFKYRFTNDSVINDPRFESKLFVAALRKSVQGSTCEGSLGILQQGAKYNYYFVSSRGLKVADFTLDAKQCNLYLKNK